MLDITLRELWWKIQDGVTWRWHRLWSRKSSDQNAINVQNIESIMTSVFPTVDLKLWKSLEHRPSYAEEVDCVQNTEREENK